MICVVQRLTLILLQIYCWVCLIRILKIAQYLAKLWGKSWLLDWLSCGFYVTRHKIGHFGDVSQANLLVWNGKTKPNTTKARITNQTKCTTTQNKHKKIKPGLVASYDIRPGNGEGLFRFRRFINLSLIYLLRYLPAYLQPWDPHGAKVWLLQAACATGHCPAERWRNRLRSDYGGY